MRSPRRFVNRLLRRGEGDLFERIYERNEWGGDESRSGPGSTLAETEKLRRELPGIVEQLRVEVFLDVPCGDWNWMRLIELPVRHYIGMDVVPTVVAQNHERYASPSRSFLLGDARTSKLPSADLVFSRDFLVHLSNRDVRKALANFRRTAADYIMTTTFTDRPQNSDIETGSWRPLNLEAPPFSWPPPEVILVEECAYGDGQFRDKSMGVWRWDAVPLS